MFATTIDNYPCYNALSTCIRQKHQEYNSFKNRQREKRNYASLKPKPKSKQVVKKVIPSPDQPLR